MIALIDGDILIYRVGYASQGKNDDGEPEALPVGLATARMDTTIRKMLDAVRADSYRVFLTSTDKSNFRHGLYPLYKANRTQPKPILYAELRAHLVADWQAEIIYGREADDAMADGQTKDSIICSIDKDLDQVPGLHYDFVKDVKYEVNAFDGIRWFYHQILSGDTIDNVPGIRGVGPKTAGKILTGASTEVVLFERVRSEYSKEFGDEGDKLMLLYGRLLKIGGDLWQPTALVNIDQDSKPLSEPRSSDSDTSTSLQT